MTASPLISPWRLTIVAGLILLITMGTRQTTGLFVSPLNTSTGLGIVGISLALAVGQFMWGLSQPIFGWLADRYGFVPMLMVGGLMLAVGTFITPWMHSQSGLIFSLGVLSATGAGAGSFSILIGAVAARIPEKSRAMATGVINAGGSLGQTLFAPLLAAVIAFSGWVHALWVAAAFALLTVPLAWLLRDNGAQVHVHTGADISLGQQLRRSLADRSYLMLHLGFFTCGFHIAFLVTHLPSEVGLCGLSPEVSAASLALIGLFNVAGSLAAGAMSARWRMKYVLVGIYGARAVIVALYLIAPKTPLTFYVFAAALGFTWLATVPPTAGLVGKLFGTRYLATLFGLTLLSHQVGGFLGAWLGGLAFASSGNYQWMWYADIALAALAAVANLPIREARPVRA